MSFPGITSNSQLKIDFEQLRKRCSMSIADFAAEPGFERVETVDGVFYFKGTGAKVLAVAHLDTVCTTNTFSVTQREGETRVYSPVLDDRLGVYIILDLLPLLGIDCDVLLTEGEESGRSTAAHFNVDGAPYNWIFEFDRKGDDVVVYQYESDAWIEALMAAGAYVGDGIFSDISAMDHLKTCAVNIGCGYHNYHSPKAYAIVEQTLAQVEMFQRFYAANIDIRFEYTEKVRTYGFNLDLDWDLLDSYCPEPEWLTNLDRMPCEGCNNVAHYLGLHEGLMLCLNCYELELWEAEDNLVLKAKGKSSKAKLTALDKMVLERML